MAYGDYSEEDDYYTQEFDEHGVVSIWVGISKEEQSDKDVLQDLCGVGYYSLDDQEANCFDFELVPIERLLVDLSYADSFIQDAIRAAHLRGIETARWTIAQFDFAYSPQKIKRPIAPDPIFLGVFPYRITNQKDA